MLLYRYLAADQAKRGWSGNVSAGGAGLAVISMSLYGAGRRYTMGAVRNAQLAAVNFPGWQLRFYVEKTSNHRHPAVPQSVLTRLEQLGAKLVAAPADRLAPMMWRFTVCYCLLLLLLLFNRR